MNKPAPGKTLSKTSIILLLIGLGFAGVLLSLFIQQEALLTHDLIQNDARIHIWWLDQMTRCQDTETDPLLQMMKTKSLRSPGFTLLLFSLSPWLSPFTVSKMLSVILLPVTLILLTLTGIIRRNLLAGVASAVITCGLALTSWSSGLVVFDGLQRSFRDPILLTGLLAMMIPSKILFAGACVLAALFYPICLPVLLVTAFLKFVLFSKISKKRRKYLVTLAVFSVLILVAGLSISTFNKPFYGFNGSVYSNPRYGHFGREPVFGPPGAEFTVLKPFLVAKSTGLLGQKESEAGVLLILSVITFILWLTASNRKIPDELSCFLMAGLSLYLLAWIIAFSTGRFLIYFPSRYNVLLLFLILLSGHLVSLQKKTITGLCLQITTLSILLIPRLMTAEHHPGYIQPEPWEHALFEKLEQMPGREIIAGPPDLLNNIPSYTCSSVYLSFEMDTEMREDWARERFDKFFDAYYTTDPNALFTFAESENVTHILVDSRMFTSEYLALLKTGLKNVYLEPCSKRVRETLVTRRGSPVLREVPENRICFQQGPLSLVNIQRIP